MMLDRCDTLRRCRRHRPSRQRRSPGSPGSVAPQSATGANGTPTSPPRWAAPPASPEFDLIQVEQWLRGQGKLPELSTVDRLWRHLAAASDTPPTALAAVGALLLARQRGERPPAGKPTARLADLLPEIDALADELGPQAAFDELWQRFSAPGPGRALRHPGRPGRPDGRARRRRRRLRPRPGRRLRRHPAGRRPRRLHLRVRAGTRRATSPGSPDCGWPCATSPARSSTGDSLRADAFAGRTVDAVVCHPPFGVTNWGDEELGYDPRWMYGPPRVPNRSWPGCSTPWPTCGSAGTPSCSMPPTVASRRAGRRIRAELLRRGALRAVDRAARRGWPRRTAYRCTCGCCGGPRPDAPPPARALLVDAADGDLAELYARVLAAWRAFTAAPGRRDRGGRLRPRGTGDRTARRGGRPHPRPPATRRRGRGDRQSIWYAPGSGWPPSSATCRR